MRKQQISENQVVIKLNEKSDGQWALTIPKNRKTDLKVGSDGGTTPSNSPGFPRIQGRCLRKIERKIGWSVGTDHPKKWGN
jgi:hypothetical protein